ncbi:MAG: DUF3500 domain-containing protein [Chthoniobacteraceae bacterium]
MAKAALSSTGYTLFAEIRNADDKLSSVNSSEWGSGMYYIAFLGTPSTTSPWMLQLAGHHIAYNITYNGKYVSAMPMFDGVEPPNWTDSSNVAHAPLETQRAAVSALATAIQADSAVSSSAKLSGTFTDVVMGVASSGHDTNFPQTYPTSGRGVIYTSLSSAEKAEVKTLIEAWVNNHSSDIAAALLADYESDAALAQTYVGYGVDSSGVASFPASPSGTSTQHSYLRVDGPRVWIEFVVQQGIAYPTQVHYHTLWRDKVADYAAEFGASLSATPPSISADPASTTAAAGSTASFSVTATGSGTLTYQWYKDAAAISGATSSSYSIASTTTDDAGSYDVMVTSEYGVSTSAVATLTISSSSGTTPEITGEPESLTVNEGDSAAFSVTATGSGTLSYQWYKGDAPIDGATGATYSIASVSTTDTGSYYAVVSNDVGSATSTVASLAVSTSSGTSPAVSTDPASLTVVAGNSATFTAAASGTGTLSWQWYKDDTAIDGATNSSYTIAATTTDDAGAYYAIVSNDVGSAQTTTATLTVTASLPVVTVKALGNHLLKEGGKRGRFRFTRTGDTTSALTVNYTLGGRAKNGTDYVGTDSAALSGSVVIPAGASTYTLIVVAVNDRKVEGTEVIRLTLSSSDTYTLGGRSLARLWILDND